MKKIKAIKTVNENELLQRDEISISNEAVSEYLCNETILVTGGGGSIGAELCRQIAGYNPKCLIIFDCYENNAYDIQMELLQHYKKVIEVHVIIGSIQDKNRLEYVFSTYKPGIVFHAAAHKHVPLMEDNPQEAIKNNIFGTLNLVECADYYQCKKFVLISTDKAVNPTSMMGATKRAAELVIQYMNSVSETQYAAVRFGNVLGSNGSVIPLFKKQIAYGGPITITHPDITRYFMTISEAASLVIQSAALMEGGEIFILDMGEQIKILELAKALITLSGLKLDKDISIEFIGLRPGEKLKEELFISEGEVDVTTNNKIFIEKPLEVDLEYTMRLIQAHRLNYIELPEDAINFIRTLIGSYRVSSHQQ